MFCSVGAAVNIVLVTDLVVLLTERYNLPAILDLKVSHYTCTTPVKDYIAVELFVEHLAKIVIYTCS